MPRYLIERRFVNGLELPIDDAGTKAVSKIVAENAVEGVTWVHSYVTKDHARTFCVYDGPSPEAVRRAAARNDLPIEHITEVRVLDPYFYSTHR
jgi:hypothetical protein